jgi:endonuclease G
MITNRLIEETERRFEQRQGIRTENRRLIKAGLWMKADTRERVQKRWQRLASKAAVTEALAGVAVPPLPPAVPDVPDSATARAFERVIGRSDLMSINYLELGLAAARSVGRVRIRGAGAQTLGYGTGFLVSPRLLLTNNHVLEDAATAANSRVEFNYQEDVTGRPLSVVSFELDPAMFFVTDVGLDFSLVAVQDADERLGEFGWLRLFGEEGKAVIGDCLSIIQHPSGEPKQLALRDNELVDVLDRFLHYRTDTQRGSSGSPVFNDQWEVVALHHSGVPAKDPNGNWLATDGSRWTPDMGDDRRKWVANEGVRISRIVRHIRERVLGGEAARIVDEMLPSDSSQWPVATRTGGAPWRQLDGGRGHPGGPIVREDGTVVWTLPIQIAVNMGGRGGAIAAAPVIVGAGSAADRAGATTTPPPSVGPRVNGRSSDPDANPDLQQALQTLKESETRQYYNKRDDEGKRRTYYRDVGDNLGSDALYDALSELVTRTHAKQPRYQPGKHVYPWVDLQPNRMLRSIYSGLEFDPAEAIREDFRIEPERERLREALESENEAARERAADEEEALEALLPYNCEHVVPQSWFDKQEPMRGDLHHLFACERKCNSFRGNTPYYDFPDEDEVFRDECGEREQNRFEPVAGKGAVARATLYFLLRYPGEIDETAGEYTQDRIDALLEWHRDYPVTLYERHRNAAIHEAQGNRNPLIDHPSWAAKIDFTRGLGGGQEREAARRRRGVAGAGRVTIGDIPHQGIEELEEAWVTGAAESSTALVVSANAPALRVAQQADAQGAEVIFLTDAAGEVRGALRPTELRYTLAGELDVETPTLVAAVDALIRERRGEGSRREEREIDVEPNGDIRVAGVADGGTARRSPRRAPPRDPDERRPEP